jgi:hypothetical protein
MKSFIRKKNIHSVYKIKYYFAKLILVAIERVENLVVLFNSWQRLGKEIEIQIYFCIRFQFFLSQNKCM